MNSFNNYCILLIERNFPSMKKTNKKALCLLASAICLTVVVAAVVVIELNKQNQFEIDRDDILLP